jgi:RHS repeat-associated protein
MDAARFPRPAAAGLVMVLLLSYAVVISSPPPAAAVEPPPGRLVDSVPDFDRTQGEFSVSDDGAARYQLPLWVPEGRGTVAPKLALSYHSRAGNGPLGVGWSLAGLPSIRWCPRTFAQDGFSDRVHFDGASALCLDGNRLLPTSPAQLPERSYTTERQEFARIIAFGAEHHVPDHFQVWTKAGQILTFGTTDDARLAAFQLQATQDLERPGLERASTDQVTVAWGLNRVEDRNGNVADVTYRRSEAGESGLWWTEMLPASITYPPHRRVVFDYGPRPDPVDGFMGGVHSRISERLTSIQMWGGPLDSTPELLLDYRLAYLDEESDSITGRSLLDSVTERDGAGVAKLPLKFRWSLGSYEFDEVPVGGGLGSPGLGIMVTDVNGDGRSDLVHRDSEDRQNPRTFVRLSTGDGFAEPELSPGGPFPVNNPSPFNFGESPLRPVDVDGDGRTEVLAYAVDGEVSTEDGWRWQLFDSTGSGFKLAADGGIGDHTPFASDEYHWTYFADLDGNGLQDFVETTFTNDGQAMPWHYRLNDGSAEEPFGERVEVSPRNTEDGIGNYAVDTDGDGRVQLLAPSATRQHGWDSWGLHAGGGPETPTANIEGRLGHSFGDLNGDGLEDTVRIGLDNFASQLNSGNGFAPTASSTIAAGFADSDGMRVVDFNGDGREDLLLFYPGPSGGTADGEHGVQLYTWTDGGFARAPVSQTISDHADWEGTQPLDIDGDGALDLVHIGPFGEGLTVYRRLGGTPDRLIQIGEAASGPQVNVRYTTLADRDVHTPGTCGYPLSCPVRGGSVVSGHDISARAVVVGDPDDVQVDFDTYLHAYDAARVDLHGRGWLGFAEHTVTRPATGATTVTTFDNRTPEIGPTTEYAAAVAYPYAGVPEQTTHTVAHGTGGRESRHQVLNGNDIRRLTGGSFTVERQQIIEIEQERQVGEEIWQLVRSRITNLDYDEFGNTDLVESQTPGGRGHTEDPEYRNDEDDWLIGLPTARRVTGCDPIGRCTTRETTFDYDEAGNPTLMVVEPNRPALTLTTVTGYGEVGEVTSVTSTDGATGQIREQLFEYGNADRLYPTATENALGHRTEIDTHSGLGVPLRTVDPNGVTTTRRFDRFGRLRETHRSDGSFELITHGWQATTGRQLFTTAISGGGSSTAVFNRLGQQIEQQVKTFDGTIATSYTDYDLLGRVWRVSRAALPGETLRYTNTGYDNRGRVTSVTEPDDTEVRTEYVNRETHTYDALGTHRFVAATVDGDVVTSYEDDPESDSWLETRFEYGPFGETTRVEAPDGTVQTMRYDPLGRRDRLVDPSSGTSLTGYNAFGEVTSETSGANERITTQYDQLGRVFRVESPDGVATNTWDTAEHGVGLLAGATSADGVVTSYTYTDQAKPETVRWTIEGTGYEIGYGYDGIGRQSRLTYPEVPGATGRLAVDNVYNPHGYLSQIQDAAVEGLVYWAVRGRNAAGQLTGERFGNRVVGEYEYEPETGLLDRLAVTGPDAVGTVASVGYDHDGNRNVVGRADSHGREERYTYDVLNRLIRWSTLVTGPGQIAINATYDYGPAGNLEAETFQRQGEPRQDLVYGYGEDGAPPHALTSRNGTRLYGYDGAGRQTTGLERIVDYNRHDLPAAVDWGNRLQMRTEFRYDADGDRVLKRDARQTVVTVAGLYERRSPAGTDDDSVHNLHNIIAEGRVVAQVNRIQEAETGPAVDQVLYVHTDGQGSTIKVTNRLGRPVGSGDSILANLFYDPFGRRIDATYEPRGHQRHGGPRQGFTGHPHDDEYGLIDMTGRIYDPEIRRFLTPDPIAQDPRSSQGHNRYAYVQNNPTTLVDPTGFMACESIGTGGDPIICGSVFAADPDPAGPPPGQPAGGGTSAPVSNVDTSAGTDDDQSAPPLEVADETIVVRGRVKCNELSVCYGTDEFGYWVEYPGMPIEYLEHEVWLRSQIVSDRTAAISQDPERYAAAFGATALDRPLGVLTAIACLAVPQCRMVAGDDALEYIFGERPEYSINAVPGSGPRRMLPGGGNQSSLPPRLPVLVIDGKLMPNIARNIESAQAAGHPSVLTRSTDPGVHNGNRNASCLRYCGSGSPDEYPFASTYEGGYGAQVRGVPLPEQRIQGGVMSQFYQRNNIRDGDRYRVVVRW